MPERLVQEVAGRQPLSSNRLVLAHAPQSLAPRPLRILGGGVRRRLRQLRSTRSHRGPVEAWPIVGELRPWSGVLVS